MGASLYFILFIIIIFIGIAILIAQSNHSEATYKDIDIEEWKCPDCGFHVQVGNICIYCNAKKP